MHRWSRFADPCNRPGKLHQQLLALQKRISNEEVQFESKVARTREAPLGATWCAQLRSSHLAPMVVYNKLSAVPCFFQLGNERHSLHLPWSPRRAVLGTSALCICNCIPRALASLETTLNARAICYLKLACSAAEGHIIARLGPTNSRCSLESSTIATRAQGMKANLAKLPQWP